MFSVGSEGSVDVEKPLRGSDGYVYARWEGGESEEEVVGGVGVWVGVCIGGVGELGAV